MDIDGTLWVDTAARALTDIEFRYLGLPPYTAPFNPGGTISFRQMPNGVVVIDRFQLRAVVAGPNKKPTSSDETLRNDLMPIEFGGELASASWDGGVKWHASLGSLKIHATKEGGLPYPGVVVGLHDTHYRGIADEHGDVLIPDLLPGPYSAEVWDPRMVAAGIAIPTRIEFVAARDSVHGAPLLVQSAEDYVAKRCADEGQGAVGAARLIVGRIVTPGGDPAIEARVTFANKTGPVQWNILRGRYETGSDGTFTECDQQITVGSPVRISVRRPNFATLDTVITPLANLTVVKVRVPSAP